MKRICGSLADKLYSRGFGKRDKKCIELSWVELAYLSEKKILSDDFAEVVRAASSQIPNFDIRYLVYRDLRDRGYLLKVNKEHFEGRKNYAMNFYPISDMDFFYVPSIKTRVFPFILSVVDSDGEVTYYMVERAEPRGEFKELPKEKINPEFYGKRAFIFQDAKELESKTYGRSEGNWGHLSLMEAWYLAEKGIVSKVTPVENDIYRVYRDLRDRGLIVKSGFKYGTHFRVYEKSIEEHSKYLVHILPEKEEMQKISRAVRVAHGVRKSLILAYPTKKDILYFKFSWIRP
jgi:tRNA-intron endonuclease